MPVPISIRLFGSGNLSMLDTEPLLLPGLRPGFDLAFESMIGAVKADFLAHVAFERRTLSHRP